MGFKVLLLKINKKIYKFTYNIVYCILYNVKLYNIQYTIL